MHEAHASQWYLSLSPCTEIEIAIHQILIGDSVNELGDGTKGDTLFHQSKVMSSSSTNSPSCCDQMV